MSDCGPPCEALKDRHHRFHLLCLSGESAAEAYRQTASSKRKQPTKVTCESMGPRMHRSTQVQAALSHHRDQDAEKFSAEKARALKRLRKIAKKGAKSEATAGDAVRAIAQESKICGWYAVEKHEHSFSPEKVDDLARKARGGDKDAAKELRDRLRELRGKG